MAEIQNFRTAFHGFNREDVVHFLESMSARHTAQVNQLKDDVQRLEGQLAQQGAAAEDGRLLEALRQEHEALQQLMEEQEQSHTALRQENEALRQEKEALQKELESLRTTGEQKNLKDEELAAYRRAENVERLARQRAAQLHDRVNGLVADLTASLHSSRMDMDAAAEAMGQSLEMLQKALDTSQENLRSGEASLREFRMHE